MNFGGAPPDPPTFSNSKSKNSNIKTLEASSPTNAIANSVNNKTISFDALSTPNLNNSYEIPTRTPNLNNSYETPTRTPNLNNSYENVTVKPNVNTRLNKSYTDERTNNNKYARVFEDRNIIKMLDIINDVKRAPLYRIEVKRSVIEYVEETYGKDLGLKVELMKVLNNTDIMRNFEKYFDYNS